MGFALLLLHWWL